MDKETVVFFNIEMKVTSPCCGAEQDLEADSEYWFPKFKEWINNEEDADKIDETFNCPVCDSDFKAFRIER